MHTDVSILDRLNRLERTNRRLKLAGVLAFSVLGAGLLMGQASQSSKRVVEAEEFRLVEKDGTLRGNWGVESEGNVAMRLLQRHGHGSLVLDANPDGSVSVGLIDGTGKVRGMWATTPEGSIVLSQTDEAGTRRGTWVVGEGLTYLSLRDKDGTNRAILGSAGLLATKTGEKTTTAESKLTLFDKNQNVIFEAPR